MLVPFISTAATGKIPTSDPIDFNVSDRNVSRLNKDLSAPLSFPAECLT